MIDARKVVLVVSILCTAAARAEVGVSLKVLAEQPGRMFPYRQAELTVENDIGSVVQAVSLQRLGGGPTFVFPVTVAPGTTLDVEVFLPAVRTEQEYVVRLLAGEDADAPVLASARASIAWPIELLTTDEFLAPRAYRPYEDDPPAWAGELLRNVFLALAIFSLLLAGTLLLRRPTVRLLVAAVIVAAAAGGVRRITASAPLVRVLRSGEHTAVACRRTATWRDGSASLAPIYYSESQMQRDNLVVHARLGLRVTIRPGEVRLFRRAGK